MTLKATIGRGYSIPGVLARVTLLTVASLGVACGSDTSGTGEVIPGQGAATSGGPAVLPTQPAAGTPSTTGAAPTTTTGPTTPARPGTAGTTPAGTVAGAAAPTAPTTPNPAAAGAGAPPAAGSGAPATAGAAAPVVGPDQPTGTEANFHDPGTGEWEMGTPADCKMDTSKITGSGNYAVFRYGKLCFVKGGDSSGMNYSATKTLGGVAAGRAQYLTRDVPRTGPGTGTFLHEDKAIDWLGSVSYNREALLSHVMSMTAFNNDLSYGKKSFSYDTLGTREISSIISVAMKAVKQVPNIPSTDAAFMREQVFMKLGMSKSSWGGGTIGTGWSSTLTDMGRIGVMLAHDGWYGGERFMSRYWVYRMSHPAHEDANTSYGQLAWLNHRGNAAGIGGDIASGSNSKEGDPCAPAAFWPKYPHEGSEAPDCRAEFGDKSCVQKYDVGVFSAQGLNGQFVVVHPGLDLVITSHNFSNQGGPMGLWKNVRPAVIAMDPKFMGDEAAFCKEYGAGNYAPDLIMPRGPQFK